MTLIRKKIEVKEEENVNLVTTCVKNDPLSPSLILIKSSKHIVTK